MILYIVWIWQSYFLKLHLPDEELDGLIAGEDEFDEFIEEICSATFRRVALTSFNPEGPEVSGDSAIVDEWKRGKRKKSTELYRGNWRNH